MSRTAGIFIQESELLYSSQYSHNMQLLLIITTQL